MHAADVRTLSENARKCPRQWNLFTKYCALVLRVQVAQLTEDEDIAEVNS